MQTITSAIGPVAAAAVALIRFCAASELGRSDERWLPTMMIGIGGFSTMKESAAAVWCIVSVPCPITIPS